MSLEKKLKFVDELQEFLAKNPISEIANKSLEEDFKVRYTYDSNSIEGNTLTLKETKVVLEGLTIGGKSINEHLEAINHAEAIDYIKEIALNKVAFSEYLIKSVHHLVLKGIDDKNAGSYRNCEVRISGANHIPPPHFNVQAQMQDFVQWYNDEAMNLHPIIRAARVHADFVGIHPFIDGNGRTSRLLMNFELLKAGLPAISIKSDRKVEYYEALDIAHCEKDYSLFDNLVADYVVLRLDEKKKIVENELKTHKPNGPRR